MKTSWWIIGVIFIFSLIIRLVFNAQFVTPWGGDQPHLFKYALNVTNGQYYGTDGVYWPPGYIFFMGLLFKIVGAPEPPHIYSVTLIQSIFGALTAVLTYFITDHLFKNRRIAIVSGLLYSILPTAVLYTGMFVTETLYLFFLFLAIWLTLISYTKGSWPWYVLTGLIYGISILIRSTAAPLLILSGVLFYLSAANKLFTLKWGLIRRKVIVPLIVLIVTAGACSVPWVIRNVVVVGEPVLSSVNPGINLYLAHNEQSTGKWVDMGPNDDVIQLHDHPDANRLGKERAWKYIFAHPWETIEQFMQVHEWFWILENTDVHHMTPNWLRYAYELFSFKLLALLGFIGIVLARNYWRTTIWLLLYMLAYNGLIDLLYYAPRYRFAIEPMLVPFAAVTVYYCLCAIRHRFMLSSQKL